MECKRRTSTAKLGIVAESVQELGVAFPSSDDTAPFRDIDFVNQLFMHEYDNNTRRTQLAHSLYRVLELLNPSATIMYIKR